MTPMILFPESTLRENGCGNAVRLENSVADALTIRLSITRIAERQSLDIYIWGSTNGEEWGSRPLLSLPPKSYCGNYSITLDLKKYPKLRYLRVDYALRGWQRKDFQSLVAFSVTAEPAYQAALAAV